MKKLVAGGIAALSIATGSAAVAALSPLTSAGAQSTTGSTPTTSTATGTSATTAPVRVNPLKSVLDGLVSDGTITQAQADAITAKMTALRAANPMPDHGGGRGFAGAPLADIATALGTTEADVRTQLEAGKSLRTIAGDKADAITKLLTDKANARIDQGVTDGKITADNAATLKAGIAAKVQAMLDRTGVDGGPGGFGGFGGRGRGGHGPDAAGAPVTTPSAAAPTTTTK